MTELRVAFRCVGSCLRTDIRILGSLKTVAVVLPLSLFGCGIKMQDFTGEQRNLLIIVDRSGSSRTDKAFQDTLDQIADTYIARKHILPGQKISIRYGGIEAEIGKSDIVYNGPAKDLDALRTKLKQLTHEAPPSVENAAASTPGTAVCETLLKPAVDYAATLAKDEPLTIVIVSDLHADPAKRGQKVLKAYQDPTGFRWSLPAGSKVALRFYYVPAPQISKLKSAWAKDLAGVDYQFFEPKESVTEAQVPGTVQGH